MKEKFWGFYKKYNICYILLILAFYCIQLLLYETSKIISTDWHVIDMKIDELIPFCKYFIVFYFTYYFFPPIQLYLMSYNDKRKFYKILISVLLSIIVSNICFWVYQVKMVRPEITGNDFFSSLVRWIYGMDKGALNCFPSIHAIMGTLMVISGFKTKGFPKWFQITSIVFGVGCIMSTVFVKQHYFIDMVVGTIIMLVFYLLVNFIDNRIIKNKEKSNI